METMFSPRSGLWKSVGSMGPFEVAPMIGVSGRPASFRRPIVPRRPHTATGSTQSAKAPVQERDAFRKFPQRRLLYVEQRKKVAQEARKRREEELLAREAREAEEDAKKREKKREIQKMIIAEFIEQDESKQIPETPLEWTVEERMERLVESLGALRRSKKMKKTPTLTAQSARKVSPREPREPREEEFPVHVVESEMSSFRHAPTEGEGDGDDGIDDDDEDEDEDVIDEEDYLLDDGEVPWFQRAYHIDQGTDGDRYAETLRHGPKSPVNERSSFEIPSFDDTIQAAYDRRMHSMDAPLSRSFLTRDDKQRIRERRMERVMMENSFSPKKPTSLTSLTSALEEEDQPSDRPTARSMDPRSSYMEMLQALRVQEEHILAKRKLKDHEEHRGPADRWWELKGADFGYELHKSWQKSDP
eukprot:TRINITY_DN842_c1_g1_i1.p1 TRINITY_DN842_c1_g1~~TRINITY_DN842_c1_g1_i1.p1  ORF type:complete len:440 (+),score=151.07 TRINITY_DN842_c1_g1_i1:72-1322(+)